MRPWCDLGTCGPVVKGGLDALSTLCCFALPACCCPCFCKTMSLKGVVRIKSGGGIACASGLIDAHKDRAIAVAGLTALGLQAEDDI